MANITPTKSYFSVNGMPSRSPRPASVDDGALGVPGDKGGATPLRDKAGGSPGLLTSKRRQGSLTDQERVKVVIRLRPPTATETGGAVEIAGNGLIIHREKTGASRTAFEFDQVLGPASGQADVYEAAVQGLVEDVLNGYNATVMAYGPTGAGKTHTLSSIQADAIGMIPRAGMEIFQRAGADTNHDYDVTLSYIQVYQETIQDLLAPEHESLQLREGPSGVYVEGVREEKVADIEGCLHHLAIGDRNRIFAFTKLNAHSSRSHAIVMFTVVRRQKGDGGAAGMPHASTVRVGRLFLVDLAGSERLKKSGSLGLRADEAKAINLSLTMLGMCINARADPNATHVPFRDSKLTRLLQESLGGNAKTSLVVAVADAREQVEESLQALQFGSRAMRVKTRAHVNELLEAKMLEAAAAAQAQREAEQALLQASLASREAELANLHELLQGEKQQNAEVIRALQRETDEREAAMRAKDSLLQAERCEREALAQRLEEAKGLHLKERSALISEVLEGREALAAALQRAEVGMAELAAQHQAAVHEIHEQRDAQQMSAVREVEVQRDDALGRAATAQAEVTTLKQQLDDTLQRAATADAQAKALQGQLDEALKQCDRATAECGAIQGRLQEAQIAAHEAIAAATTHHAQELERLQAFHLNERIALESQLLKSAEALSAVKAEAQAEKAAMTLQHLAVMEELQKESDAQQRAAVQAVEVQRDKALQRATLAEAEVQSLKGLLEESEDAAERSVEAASMRHANVLQNLQAEHKAELEATTSLHASMLETATASHRAAMEAAGAQHASERAASASAAAVALDAERTALAATRAETDHVRGQLRSCEEELSRTSAQVTELLAHSAALLQQSTDAAAHNKLLEAELHKLEATLQERTAEAANLTSALAGMERAHSKLLEIHFSTATRSHAARIIQRAFRAARVRALEQDASQQKEELARAAARQGRLEIQRAALQGEKTALQDQHQQWLAWSGQTMIANSVNVMEQAVEHIRAAFLLPQKDLRLLENAKRNIALSSPGASTPRTSPSNWSIRSFSVANMRRPSFARLSLASPVAPVGTPSMEGSFSYHEGDDAENQSVLNTQPQDPWMAKVRSKLTPPNPSPLGARPHASRLK